MRRKKKIEPYAARYTLVWLYSPKGAKMTDEGLVEIPAGLGTPRVCLGDPRGEDWARVRGTICIVYPASDSPSMLVKRTIGCLLEARAAFVHVVWPDERTLESY